MDAAFYSTARRRVLRLSLSWLITVRHLAHIMDLVSILFWLIRSGADLLVCILTKCPDLFLSLISKLRCTFYARQENLNLWWGEGYVRRRELCCEPMG
jgi:hypothetical protein